MSYSKSTRADVTQLKTDIKLATLSQVKANSHWLKADREELNRLVKAISEKPDHCVQPHM